MPSIHVSLDDSFEFEVDVDDIDGLDEHIKGRVDEVLADGIKDFFTSEQSQEYVDQLAHALIDRVLAREDRFERLRGSVIDDVTERLREDYDSEVRANVEDMVHARLQKNNYAILGAALAMHKDALDIKVTKNELPTTGYTHIKKMIGSDESLVTQLVDAVKHDVAVTRLLVNNINYYYELCRAVSIDTDTYCRIRHAFIDKAQAIIDETPNRSNDELIEDAKRYADGKVNTEEDDA